MISALKQLGMRVQMKDDRGNQNEYVDARECEGQKKLSQIIFHFKDICGRMISEKIQYRYIYICPRSLN